MKPFVHALASAGIAARVFDLSALHNARRVRNTPPMEA